MKTSKFLYLWLALIFLMNVWSIRYMMNFADTQTILLDEPSYLTFENLPFPSLQKSYKRGETPKFMVQRGNAHKFQETYIVARELVNIETRATYDLQSSTVTVLPGFSEIESHSSPIPRDVPPGTYFIRGDALTSGKINTVKQFWRTEEFQITE